MSTGKSYVLGNTDDRRPRIAPRLAVAVGHGPKPQRKHLLHYWTQYLYPSAARPRTAAEASAIHDCARHGVVHHFFPKGSIGITGSDPGAYLTLSEDGVLIIDAKVLLDDLVRTYRQRVVPLLATQSGSPSRASMQKRLNDIRSVGHLKTPQLRKIFSAR